MTEKQSAIICTNLNAFEYNFGGVRIEKAGRGFEVFYPENSEYSMQYCENIHYLNGWLYGCVQGFLRGEFKA